jgi:hypothetical protein
MSFENYEKPSEDDINDIFQWLAKKRNMDDILEDIDSWNKIQKNKYDYTDVYKNCRGCNEFVPGSWISRNIYHLCDNYVQPYMTNPNNMKYMEKYFSKEIVELIKEKRISLLDIKKKEDYWNANSIERLIINCDLDGIKFLVKK